MAAHTGSKLRVIYPQLFRQCLSKYAGLSTSRWSIVSQYHQTSGHDAIIKGETQEESASQEQLPRNRQKRQKRVGHQPSFVRSTQQKDTVSRRKEKWKEDPEWFQSNPEKKEHIRRYPFKEGYEKTDEAQCRSREDKRRPYYERIDNSEIEQHKFFKPILHDKAAQEMLLVQVPKQPTDPHLLKVAIIGTPNVGKSTLVNSLLGRRIFSVSEKVHTTRSKAFAVINQDNKQIIVLDTPGIVDNKVGRKHKVDRSLLVDYKHSLLEADLVVVLVDASLKYIMKEGLHFDIRKQLCLHPHLKSVLILNKIDLVKRKHDLVGITARLTSGKVAGKDFEITEKAAAKLGSLDRGGFMKLSYRAPSAGGPGNVSDARGDEGFLDSKATPPGDKETDKSIVFHESSQSMESLPTEQQNHISEDSSEVNKSVLASDCDIANSGSNNQSVAEHLSEGEIKDELIGIRKDTHDLESVANMQDPDDTETYSNWKGGVEQQVKANVMKEYISNLKEISPLRSARDNLSYEEVLAREKAAQEEQAKKKAAERELNMRVAAMQGWDGFDAVFMISAMHGEGIKEVKSYLLDQTTPRDWEYHDDVVTNLSPQEIVKEAIREQLLETCRQEVPYQVEQRNEFWGIGEHGELKIVQELLCPRESISRMIQRRVGLIAVQAQQQLMNAFHCEVHLVLGVSVDKNRARRL